MDWYLEEIVIIQAGVGFELEKSCSQFWSIVIETFWNVMKFDENDVHVDDLRLLHSILFLQRAAFSEPVFDTLDHNDQ